VTPADWKQRWKDDTDERAAIRKYDGHQVEWWARVEAEREVKAMARGQQKNG
jgi:hypothetical protein